MNVTYALTAILAYWFGRRRRKIVVEHRIEAVSVYEPVALHEITSDELDAVLGAAGMKRIEHVESWN
tara:strand:- start:40 stop:240 length:201 start_codon:yes stop_codon:yes gene_type:complete